MTSNNSSGSFWGALVSLFRVISNLLLIYYFILFLVWYVKGHFGKYFIFFWTWTALSISIYFYQKHKIERENEEYMRKWGNKSGQEIWNENMKDYDPVRGY